MQLEPAEQMKVAMKRADVTQAILADAIDVHPSTLGNYLSGDRSWPEGLEAKAWATIKRLSDEKAERIRAEAEEKARKLVEGVFAAAPVEEAVVAA